MTIEAQRAVHQRIGLVFFFQAEDGIRDLTVTGVQTCALPIFPSQYRDATPPANPIFSDDRDAAPPPAALPPPREEAGAVTSFVVQSQESEQLDRKSVV